MVISTLSTSLRFQMGSRKQIGEAEEHQVLHRLLAQVMIDAEDRRFGEELRSVALSSWAEARSRPKGFSTTTRALSRSPPRQPFGDGREQAGRDGEIMQRTCGASRALAKCGERGRIAVIAVDIAQERARVVEAAGSSAAVFFQTVLARALSWSRFQPALATPMTGMLSAPWLIIDCSAGKIFL